MTHRKAFVAAAAFGGVLGVLLTLSGPALAGRNSSGTYSSPSSDFVTGTVISSSVMNAKLTDLGTELTDSLSRSGKGGMLARLRGVDGTSALPAYAFTSETTLGLYRAGSDDLRCSSNGTDIQKWSATGITAYQAVTAEKGLTVTNSTTNGAGVTATGDGSGAGGVFAGGATGRGLTVASNGGASGLVVTGGGTNAKAAEFTATGNAAGVTSTGGSSGGTGVVAFGSGTGGYGIVATGGADTPGVVATAGTAATTTTAHTALQLNSGHLFFNGVTSPNKDVAISNTLTPANIPKAWAHILTTTSNTQSVQAGFNISGVATVGSAPNRDVRVTLATAMAGTDYAIIMSGSDGPLTIAALSRTTTTFDIHLTGTDLGNKSADIYVVVFGAQ